MKDWTFRLWKQKAIISAYHHLSCEFEPRSWRGVLYATLYDKVCQWHATGWWFSPGTPVSSTNKTDRHVHVIAEILLKVTLNTINPTNQNKKQEWTDTNYDLNVKK